MIADNRKRQLKTEVATFAATIIDRAADTCAVQETHTDEEDAWFRESMRKLAVSIRKIVCPKCERVHLENDPPRRCP
jgi:hypothetical protein